MNDSRFDLDLARNLTRHCVGFAIIQLSVVKKWGLVLHFPMHKGKKITQQQIPTLLHLVYSFKTNLQRKKLLHHQQKEIVSAVNNLVVPIFPAKTGISWARKIVCYIFSLRLCLDLINLYQVMFLDSTITKNSQLSKTKYSYGVTFGVAPYVRNVLKEMIKIPPFLTIVFDVN